MGKLSKDKAIAFHRVMWISMERKLGDCPNETQRSDFKKRFCEEIGMGNILHNCFLCEYDCQSDGERCSNCPIKWNTTTGTCYGTALDGETEGSAHRVMPISWILSQEEKFKSNE